MPAGNWPNNQAAGATEEEEAALKIEMLKSEMRCGEGLRADPRMAAHWAREDRLVKVLEDPFGRWRSTCVTFWMYLKQTLGSKALWLILAVYATAAVACSIEDHSEERRGVCAGPTTHTYDDYWPTILNTFSTFLLVFYASQVYTRYVTLYSISAECKHRVSDLLVLASGTARDGSNEHLLALWAAGNMVHATAYQATDSKLHTDSLTQPYSVDGFIKPFAEAFGHKEHGMLSQAEFDEMDRLRDAISLNPSALHNLYWTRVYRIIQEMIDRKLTPVPWPAWQNALSPFLTVSKRLTVEADYKMPRMYKILVETSVNVTLFCDAFVLGTEVGLAFQERDMAFQYGWVVCVMCTMLVLTLLLVCKSFEKLIDELSNPYGDDPVDFPVLTWCSQVATETLHIVLNSAAVRPNAMVPKTVIPAAVRLLVRDSFTKAGGGSSPAALVKRDAAAASTRTRL